jgi:maleate cis-trans isomerase
MAPGENENSPVQQTNLNTIDTFLLRMNKPVFPTEKRAMDLRQGQYGSRCRLGLILPSMNVCTEPEWSRLVPKDVSFHTTRMLLHGPMTPESFARMDEDVASAAFLLGTARVNAIAYACTAGSVLADSERIIQVIERESGVPAVTMAKAVIEAMLALGLKRIAVATPYVPFVNEQERAFLESAGFEVTQIIGLGLGKKYEERLMIARQREEVTYELAKRVNSPEADAIFISCGALASIGILGRLEKEVEKPVFSSTVVAFWATLRRTGIEVSIPGFGSLLEKYPPLPAPATGTVGERITPGG